MRTFLRILVLPPLFVAFLGFASIQWERTPLFGTVSAQHLQLGLPGSPWLEYHHVGPEHEWEWLEQLGARTAEAASTEGSTTIEMRIETETSWTFHPVSWSALCGVLFLALAGIYTRLGIGGWR